MLQLNYLIILILGVVPVIMRPRATPKEEPKEFVALTCYWYYVHDASRINFHVQWFRDSSLSKPTFESYVNGNASQEYYELLFEHKFHPDRTTGHPVDNRKNGFEWNKKVAFCCF